MNEKPERSQSCKNRRCYNWLGPQDDSERHYEPEEYHSVVPQKFRQLRIHFSCLLLFSEFSLSLNNGEKCERVLILNVIFNK